MFNSRREEECLLRLLGKSPAQPLDAHQREAQECTSGAAIRNRHTMIRTDRPDREGVYQGNRVRPSQGCGRCGKTTKLGVVSVNEDLICRDACSVQERG